MEAGSIATEKLKCILPPLFIVMITMKVWKCSKCRTENTFANPSIMIVMRERDYCKNCGKARDGEFEYRVRVQDD